MRRRPSARAVALVTSRAVSYLAATGLIAAGLVLPAAAPASAATVPSGFTDEPVTAVYRPTSIAFTPDGRMLVATQPGLLRVVRNGSLLDTPALDLTSRICANSERGLLSVVADPNPSPGYVYVFWTVKAPARTARAAPAPTPRARPATGSPGSPSARAT